jgi:hypothetical protein
MKRVLSIFDFDGTLVRSPMPDVGRLMYEQKTGVKYPHRGWWGRVESLDTTMFDIETIPEVIKDYKLEIADPANFVVLMTGRQPQFTEIVKTIIESKELKFDDYYFNTGGETCSVKKFQIMEILKQQPDIKVIKLWDDRVAHIPQFKRFFEGLLDEARINSYEIHLVDGGQHDPLPDGQLHSE